MAVPHVATQRPYFGVPASQRKAVRHACLVRAAVEVFGTEGYHGATVAQLYATAGLTERYFYEAFPSKEALFLATYDMLQNQLMVRIRAAVKSEEAPVLVRIEQSILAFLDFIREERWRGRILLIECVRMGKPVATRTLRVLGEYASTLERELGAMPSRFNSDHISLPLLASGLIGSNVLITMRWMHDDFQQPMASVLHAILVPYRACLSGAESA